MTVIEKSPIERDWWQDWFNEIYMDVYAHRDDASAVSEVASVIEVLGLRADTRVLDLCCGSGRHCRALSAAGIENLIGVDYSMPLLEQARTASPQPAYVRGDMRSVPLRDHTMDAVLSFFTSFGYFPTSEQNAIVLHEIARVLKPGGRFMLDYLNPDVVIASLEPFTERHVGEYHIRETRSVSPDGHRVEKEIVIQTGDEEPKRFVESVRLYSRDEMHEMMGNVGLTIEATWGDFSGAPYGSDSPRMILTGRS